MSNTKNALNWFEIPVSDLARATRFYETVLGIKLIPAENGVTKMAMFPQEGMGVSGCLVQDPSHVPSKQGTIVYLDASGKIADCVKRAGVSSVALPVTDISPHGSIAHIDDTEGNRVGLHAHP